ncbi:MAG: DUF1372 family protein, partial [bacterium]|nr:DUF1372 family protein [bacterium]
MDYCKRDLKRLRKTLLKIFFREDGMRHFIILILVIMVFGIGYAHFLTGAPGAELRDKDNYGEIVGKIVDGE